MLSVYSSFHLKMELEDYKTENKMNIEYEWEEMMAALISCSCPV